MLTRASPLTLQKCLKMGHFTYECTNARPYTARPSRTKELSMGASGPKRDKPSVEVPDEFRRNASGGIGGPGAGGAGIADRILKAKEEVRARERRREEKAKRSAAKKAGKGKHRQA